MRVAGIIIVARTLETTLKIWKRNWRNWRIIVRIEAIQRFQNWSEYEEESRRTEETYCHPASSVKTSVEQFWKISKVYNNDSNDKRKNNRELKKKCGKLKVIKIPIVTGVLGTVPKGLIQGLKDLEIRGWMETIQTKALSRSARILRSVLETWRDLLLLKLQWKTID